MAPAKPSSSKDTYSVILPTFNERQNLPIITWLLNRTFTEQCVSLFVPFHPSQQPSS
jgi:dolichol-phosphate mannosyltransferase